MKKTISLLSIVATLLFVGMPAYAAKPTNTSGGSTATPVGNDISWPQCGYAYPKSQAFGVVGVNGGLANNSNPCFQDQLAWAQASSGTTNQTKAQLYVNTGNPGHLSAVWPTSNTYGGVSVANPYGTCSGAEDAACAYMYGWSRAYDDTHIRNVTSPASFKWWLDVETGNSWHPTDLVQNRATLEGMVNHFTSLGASVGVYSTTYQYGQIAGTIPGSSNLYTLDSWIPGARSLKNAQGLCTSTPLTAASKISLTQYVQNGFDFDYSCV